MINYKEKNNQAKRKATPDTEEQLNSAQYCHSKHSQQQAKSIFLIV
jgi:hypothetical protein